MITDVRRRSRSILALPTTLTVWQPYPAIFHTAHWSAGYHQPHKRVKMREMDEAPNPPTRRVHLKLLSPLSRTWPLPSSRKLPPPPEVQALMWSNS